jgi:hypothetical protein
VRGLTSKIHLPVDGRGTADVGCPHGHPGDLAKVAALDQARAAVADVDDELTREIVARMLTEVERCHRIGAAYSPRLKTWCRTTNVALYIASRSR